MDIPSTSSMPPLSAGSNDKPFTIRFHFQLTSLRWCIIWKITVETLSPTHTFTSDQTKRIYCMATVVSSSLFS